MQSTNIPSKIPLPFAYAAGGSYIRTIPSASQIGITAGAASLRDGFPPVTFSPIGSGGTPPFGQDFNGILNEITAIQQWQEAGGFFAYDSTFSTTIGGYPKGAILQSTSFNGFWTSTAENNTTNPDSGGAGWVATAFEGLETISTTGGTTTLTNLQAAYPIISITGALTSNAIITMPNIAGSWIIANNTTGSYTLTVKTSAGTGITIAQSYSAMCYGDTTNIYYSDSAVAIAANTALTNSASALTIANSALNPIQPLNVSIGSNALTINSQSYTFQFKTSLTSGTVTSITQSPASLTIPYSATLGTVSGQLSTLAVIVMNNSGTLQYGVTNLAGGVDLSETGLISTTAMSLSATSASTVYSNAALTNVPYRVVGFIQSTQTTAGTWTASPSLLQGVGGQAFNNMQTLGFGQTLQNVTSSRTSGATYYNTTNRPIVVYITAESTSNISAYGTIYLTINGSLVITSTATANGSYVFAGATGIIPVGSSYSAVMSSITTSWFELR